MTDKRLVAWANSLLKQSREENHLDTGDCVEFLSTFIESESLSNEKLAAIGLSIVSLLGLEFNDNGRIDTSYGDKTPLGLAKTILRQFEPLCETCEQVKSKGGFGPSHNGSPSCQSGSIASGGNKAHCTCDTCF